MEKKEYNKRIKELKKESAKIDKYNSEGMLRKTNVKGTIIQNKEGNLTLRLFLSNDQKEGLALERGEIKGIKIIVL